jgi:hypothetical protein
LFDSIINRSASLQGLPATPGGGSVFHRTSTTTFGDIVVRNESSGVPETDARRIGLELRRQIRRRQLPQIG